MLRALCFILLSFIISSCGVKQTPSINKVNINQNWKFKVVKANVANDSWEQVSLPHTPKIEPMVVNDQWQGDAIYEKTLDISPTWKDKKVFIRFEAAMSHAQVWLNDTKLGEHLGGYLPFTYDLTDLISETKPNIIKVKLSNLDNPVIGPKPLNKLDFNTYGGLYRDVNLLIKDRLYITDEMHANKVASGGIFVTYPKVSAKTSTINVKTHIANDYKQSKDFTLKQKVYFNNELVAETSDDSLSLQANDNHQYNQTLNIENAHLWSPNSPNLYQLSTEIYLGDELIEQKNTRIGIRKFEFNAKHELLINGEKTFLRGVNRHQEYPHVGYATSAQADYRDAVKIKSAGFDYVRLSHYPHSKAFMDAADELGLVLIDAILGWQYYLENPDFKQQIINTCHDLIRRDRNHASVLAWECSLNESWMPEPFIADLHRAVKLEDPTGFSAGWQLGYDLYLQARQHRQKHYEVPTQPYNVSEYGDWEYYAQNAGLNQDSWSDLKEEERTSRQLLSAGEARLLQQARNLQEAHNDNLSFPAFADGYWVMFDYNRGYADDLESSGIMSLYRLPKYSYYFYQSQRSPQIKSDKFDSGPMVFIASEWNGHSSNNVRVFSNADEVELWLNNTLIAKQKPTQNKLSSHLTHPPFEFAMQQFKPGQLKAKAFIDGELVAEHSVTTAGEPAGIKLSIDISGQLPAVGVKDVVFAYAQLVDNKGNLVHTNGDEIHFSTTGDIEIVYSSDSLTEQGKAAVLLRIGESLKGGTIQASSSALNIKSSPLQIENLSN
ncbi:glycoside hydrolase family 2 TIM barrel-domain containing protein [Pseudoalteromonas sp. HL-AS1]|uniref:glycoside hydrolase family 2 protein n=1 Tax=Pseudoalteromonas sp. HL-AS1 TaxID=3071081 RepID=UPI002814A1E6|nr:glycoside hydrolase family 2 TIM barrel-domain containing protein [Pseudoalteromonas sp. HL-AS1]WMS90609.1 glycoside hydrolase family 2 TIM barrel-domain containing protein [Pseudoalteromonas sp. HL-AS1]